MDPAGNQSGDPLGLLRPLPLLPLIGWGSAVLIAGAAYCMGYEGLRGGAVHWPLSLLWSACAVLPWFALLEWVKREHGGDGSAVSVRQVALWLAATAIASLALEYVTDRLLGLPGSPLGLQIWRRVPAIGAVLLLILLVRREQRRSAPVRQQLVDRLVAHAPLIRWIGAADNYVELHLPGRVLTLRLTMREAADALGPMGFMRIHRSLIVNRSHVTGICGHKDKPVVKMDDGAELAVGRAFASELRHFATKALSARD
jgi:hypothetical protein